MHGPVEKVGDIVQVVKWCRQIKKRSGNYPSSKWCFCLVFWRPDDKGPVVVLEGGGWKLRCEFLGSLKYFLHGLVERVGEKQSGNYPSSKWCFCFVFWRQDEKGPVVVLEGGVEVEMWISGKSEVFPAWSGWKGMGHSLGSKWCRQNKKQSGNYPSSKWCFCLVFWRQDDKGPVVVLDGGVEVEMWISGKSEVFPAWSGWKGMGHSLGSKWCRQNKKQSASSEWCFCLVFWRQDDKGPVVVLEGGGVEVEMWISGKSEVFPARSGCKGRAHSAGSKGCRRIKRLKVVCLLCYPCGCFVCVCVSDPVPKGTQHPFADKQSNMRSCMSVQ